MENILVEIGAFGRYQKCAVVIIGMISLLVAMAIYSSVFILAVPDMICDEINSNNTFTKMSETCEIWENKINSLNSTYECKFDTKYYGKTLTTEWNFLCSKKIYASMTTTVFMVGSFSAFFMGYFSDKFGRKRTTLVISILTCSIFILFELTQLKYFNLSVNKSYILYLISQFLLGVLGTSLYSASFVLLIESTTSEYNTLVSNINLYFYSVGELVVAIVAYFWRDWHILNWFMGLYGIVIVIILILLLPESPRFLVANKRYDEAYLVLKQISKYNGKKKSL